MTLPDILTQCLNPAQTLAVTLSLTLLRLWVGGHAWAQSLKLELIKASWIGACGHSATGLGCEYIAAGCRDVEAVAVPWAPGTGYDQEADRCTLGTGQGL